MSQNSQNLNLPYLMPAQAQKHVTHNEALRDLDIIVQAQAQVVRDEPPAAPQAGDKFLISNQPAGDWANKANDLAAYIDGGWIYLTPNTGWRIWISAQSQLYIYDGQDWMPLTFETLTVGSALAVNGLPDASNPLTVRGARSLFDNDGDDHRIKINKMASGDVASLVYQSNYQGAAEIGLIGDDDYMSPSAQMERSFKPRCA